MIFLFQNEVHNKWLLEVQGNINFKFVGYIFGIQFWDTFLGYIFRIHFWDTVSYFLCTTQKFIADMIFRGEV